MGYRKFKAAGKTIRVRTRPVRGRGWTSSIWSGASEDIRDQKLEGRTGYTSTEAGAMRAALARLRRRKNPSAAALRQQRGVRQKRVTAIRKVVARASTRWREAKREAEAGRMTPLKFRAATKRARRTVELATRVALREVGARRNPARDSKGRFKRRRR